MATVSEEWHGLHFLMAVASHGAATTTPNTGNVTNDYFVDEPLMQMIFAGVYLMSTWLAARAILSYRRYLATNSIIIESPAMFLLPWMAACDIIAASIGTILLWPGMSRDRGFLVIDHLSKLQRIVHASHTCYFLLIVMLSVHTMSVAGYIQRRFDMNCGEYYGLTAAILAFAFSHPVFANTGIYSAICFTLIPSAALIAVAMAAVCTSKAMRSGSRICVLRLNDSEDIEATVDISEYVGFSSRAAVLVWLHHLPWFFWSHIRVQTWWLPALACLCVCARGELPFTLSKISPATNMQQHVGTSNSDNEHDHQE
ncbi:hypothetical protein BX070DRAFT_235881 [Coemansia spiralis]|nr:hypothetical protein BX070DRAFT_235881 [Coemansia spiralis]